MATHHVQLTVRAALLGAVLLGLIVSVAADSLYTYRDESGALVFSDRPPDGGQVFERELRVAHSTQSPEVTIRVETTGSGVALWADNDCHCPAQVAIRLIDARDVATHSGDTVIRLVAARGSTQLMNLPATAGLVSSRLSADVQSGYEFGFIFGDPDTQHAPAEGYRPPFAAGRRFMISQAFPDAVTHLTLESRYAIDILMPEQTAIYAARAGIVVEVAHSNFRGGADWGKYGAQANIVKIMHDDSSFAIYAHLSWDSIRVRPGQRVRRGEHIAASGNTGFSTGPHLHFVVVRNQGLRTASVPVRFSDGRGGSVAPQSGEPLQNP